MGIYILGAVLSVSRKEKKSHSFFGKSRFDIFEKYWILMPSHPVFEFSDWAELPTPPKLTHHALSNKAKPNEAFDGGGCHSEGRGDI